MISDIIVGHVYKSKGNNPYAVHCIAEHGHTGEPVVIYRNLEDTSGYPAGKLLALPESAFKVQFSCYTEGKYHEQNRIASEPTTSMFRSWSLSLLDKPEPDDGASLLI